MGSKKMKAATLAGAATAAAFLVGVQPAQAAGPVTVQQPTSTVHPTVISGLQLSVVQSKWGLWHGKVVDLKSGRRLYYGPGRLLKSDAWEDAQEYADGL